MSELTLEELARILRVCAGESERPVVDVQFAQTPLADLGYDSLAVLETAAQLKREYGVDLSDEEVSEAETPGRLLELARRRLAAAS